MTDTAARAYIALQFASYRATNDPPVSFTRRQVPFYVKVRVLGGCTLKHVSACEFAISQRKLYNGLRECKALGLVQQMGMVWRPLR